MAGTGEPTLEVRIWRGAGEGAFRAYAVPRRENQTVLDVVTWIQRHLDPTLAYRFACRVGMCGSCAMSVNGIPRWTCRTHVAKVAKSGALTVAPLRNLPVIKDLAADLAPFFAKWAKAEGKFVPKPGLGPDFAVVRPDTRERARADAAIECIGCAVCYAACDVVRWLPDYLGPAALNRAWALINDARDGAGTPRLAAVAGDAGCHACHGQEGCRQHCPKSLDPTGSIAGLKRLSALAALKGEL
ncbi:MAG: succinate dehydrogenase/fumarate reductase iron-sulfur subunit [Rhodospirillales bacterium]|nr:succinate dehydrogenase/fumarate reductase iron-sulfur subunit [Rhodospirillales bacterium]